MNCCTAVLVCVDCTPASYNSVSAKHTPTYASCNASSNHHLTLTVDATWCCPSQSTTNLATSHCTCSQYAGQTELCRSSTQHILITCFYVLTRLRLCAVRLLLITKQHCVKSDCCRYTSHNVAICFQSSLFNLSTSHLHPYSHHEGATQNGFGN